MFLRCFLKNIISAWATNAKVMGDEYQKVLIFIALVRRPTR